MKSVSVVIPSKDRMALLDRCLISVEIQDYPDKEIIVIDDGSADDTFRHVRKSFPEIEIIRNLKPLGPAFAKNQGIIASRGRYIYFLDSDSQLIFKDTISTMVGIMEADKSIGILGGIADLDAQGNIRQAYGRKVTKDGRSYAISLKKESAGSSEEKLKECDFVETCNCFTRRDILSRIGGFDPYYVYMGEDKELGIKAKRLGYKTLFGFRVACQHSFDERVSFDRRFMYLKNKMRFAIKNRGLRYFFITPILDLFLFFIYYPCLFILSSICPDLKAGRLFEDRVHPNLRPPDVKWLFLSPYYFFKVYLLTLKELPSILHCGNFNFLSFQHLKAYRDSADSVKRWLKR